MKLSNNISDRLIIEFDKTGDDEAVLIVSREVSDITSTWCRTKLEVINEFKGDDAIALYNFLKKKKIERENE